MHQLSYIVPQDLAKAVLAFLTIGFATHLYQHVKSFHSEMFEKNTKETNEIKNSVSDVKISVDGLKKEVGEVKDKVEQTVKEIDGMNQYKDAKKRRIKDFEDDWDAVKIDFYRLNNDNIIFYASLLKDCIRDFALEASTITNELEGKKSMEIILERLAINLQNCYITASSAIDKDFVEYFIKRNAFNKENLIKELQNIVDGKLNNRIIGIFNISHAFLRQSWNTLFLSYQEYYKK